MPTHATYRSRYDPAAGISWAMSKPATSLLEPMPSPHCV